MDIISRVILGTIKESDVAEYFTIEQKKKWDVEKLHEWEKLETDKTFLEWLSTQDFIVNSDVIPTFEQFKLDNYNHFRQAEYMKINQFEYMFDYGFDAWKKKIQDIKSLYPKGNNNDV